MISLSVSPLLQCSDRSRESTHIWSQHIPTMNVISVCPARCCYAPSTSACPFSPRCQSTNAALSLSPTRLLPSPLIRGGRSVSSCPSSSALRADRDGSTTAVSAGLKDFLGGDLLGFDLDQWYKDVEDYGSIAVYAPAEGGYEGRYATRLKQEGYEFMNITARGLGDPEAYLTKIHGVRPAHLGKQALECFYHPPELDHRLSAMPEDCKGLILWVIEAKVLSKTELQFLALLPALRKKVKVIAECGTWRSYRWKPLREVAGLPLSQSSDTIEESKGSQTADAPKATVTKSQVEEKPPVGISL